GQPHGQSNGQPHAQSHAQPHSKPHVQPHGQSHSQPHGQSQQQPQQPQHPSSPPPKPHYQDQNQANQHDAHYTGLRAQANTEGDAMARAYEQSHEAYARGDGAGAKQLSNEGHAHKDKMESLNKQASDWIFVENNKDSKPGEIDLHGLYVKEAISHTDQAIVQAKQRGDADIHLIVGKGIHSQGGHAKIKPAIEELMQKHQLVAELDPHNAGVLIVRLDGQGQGMNPDEVSRRLDSNQDCVIM
ncbi:DUF1771-domain-containing protein, partial [Athelia psychrophila]